MITRGPTMRILVLFSILLYFTSYSLAGNASTDSLNVSKETVEKCYQSLVNWGYYFKDGTLYHRDDAIYDLDLERISSACRDPNWQVRASKYSKNTTKYIEEKMKLFYAVKKLFYESSLSDCYRHQKRGSVAEQMLNHTAAKCLKLVGRKQQCNCLQEKDYAPNSEYMQKVVERIRVVEVTNQFRYYMQTYKQFKQKFSSDNLAFLNCDPRPVFDNEVTCQRFQSIYDNMKSYFENVSTDDEYRKWYEEFKGGNTWKLFAKKLVKTSMQGDSNEHKGLGEMVHGGNSLCSKQGQKKQCSQEWRRVTISKNSMQNNFSKDAFYAAKILNLTCIDLIKVKERLCTGKVRATKNDLKRLSLEDYEGQLELLSADCKHSLKEREYSSEEFRRFVETSSEYRKHAFGKVFESLNKVSIPKVEHKVGSSKIVDAKHIELEGKTISETLKDNLGEYAHEQHVSQRRQLMPAANNFNQVNYSKALDKRSMAVNEAQNSKSVEQQKDQEQLRRIEQLEKQLQIKEKAAKRAKDKKKKNEITIEMKRLLDEIKAIKEENKKLRAQSKITNGPSVSDTRSNIRHTATGEEQLLPNKSAHVSAVSRSETNVNTGSAVNAINKPLGSSISVSSSGRVTSEERGISQPGAKQIKIGSVHNSKTMSSKLLQFSYAEFAKMDKQVLYNENKGQKIEIIKKDKQGKAVVYVLEPIINDKGEFVDFRMVEKKKIDKPQVKESEAKSDKPSDKIPSKKGSRAWYQKLIDVFKTKVPFFSTKQQQ